MNREFLVITYRTDPDDCAAGAGTARGRRAVGQIRIHPHAGFDRLRRLHRDGQVIPVSFRGRKGGYSHCMFLTTIPQSQVAASSGAFPRSSPSRALKAEIDELVGTLDYGPVRVATATMGYKHKEADRAAIKAALAAPNFLLEDHPACRWHAADLRARRVLSRGHRGEGRLDGTRSASLSAHALAPVADLPVLEVVSAVHILSDVTLGLGKVVHDYLSINAVTGDHSCV